MDISIHMYNLAESLPLECVLDCTHQGACDDDVTHWRKKLGFHVEAVFAVLYLQDTGAHTREEWQAMSDTELDDYVLWMLCHERKDTLVEHGQGQ